jgi:hypothetical protein
MRSNNRVCSATAGAPGPGAPGGQSAALHATRALRGRRVGRLPRRRPVILEFDNHLDARCRPLIGVSEQWFSTGDAFYLVPLLAALAAGAAFGILSSVKLQSGPAGRDC